MKRTTVVIALLVALLVGSNAWWASKLLDAGVSYTYLEVSLSNYQEATEQLLALAPVLAAPGATRERILEVARATANDTSPFEKEGFVWVGRLGLRFSEDGALVEVRPSWD